MESQSNLSSTPRSISPRVVVDGHIVTVRLSAFFDAGRWSSVCGELLHPLVEPVASPAHPKAPTAADPHLRSDGPTPDVSGRSSLVSEPESSAVGVVGDFSVAATFDEVFSNSATPCNVGTFRVTPTPPNSPQNEPRDGPQQIPLDEACLADPAADGASRTSEILPGAEHRAQGVVEEASLPRSFLSQFQSFRIVSRTTFYVGGDASSRPPDATNVRLTLRSIFDPIVEPPDYLLDSTSVTDSEESPSTSEDLEKYQNRLRANNLVAKKVAVNLFAGLLTLVQQSSSLVRSTATLDRAMKKVLIEQREQKHIVERWVTRAEFAATRLRELNLKDFYSLQTKYEETRAQAEVLCSELAIYRQSFKHYKRSMATFQDTSEFLRVVMKSGATRKVYDLAAKVNGRIKDSKNALKKVVRNIHHIEKSVSTYRMEAGKINILSELALSLF